MIPPLKGFLVLFFCITLSIFSTSCNFKSTEEYPEVPAEAQGKLYFVGMPTEIVDIVNSQTAVHSYYEYDLATKNIRELDPNSTFSGPDGFKEKVTILICHKNKQSYELIGQDLVKNVLRTCDTKSLDPDALKYIESKLDLYDYDNMTTADGLHTITFDHINKRITVVNNQNNASTTINLKNDFCCQTLSPDSRYVALFEYQPGKSFYDTKDLTYKLRFINLATGQIYSIAKDNVVFPVHMEWTG